MYTVTEDISLNGDIIAYRIYPNGELKKVSTVDAGGTSTCYITLGGEDASKLIVANYWNSTLVSFPVDTVTGEVGEKVATYDPLQGKTMKAKAGSHVNHSHNDASTIAERQADPHSHAIVLDPICGCIACVINTTDCVKIPTESPITFLRCTNLDYDHRGCSPCPCVRTAPHHLLCLHTRERWS